MRQRFQQSGQPRPLRGYGYLIVLPCLVAGLLWNAEYGYAQDPNPEKPFESLKLAGIVPASQSLYEKGEQREQAIRKALEKADKSKKVDKALVNGLIRDINALKQISARLQYYGETASTDWRIRCVQYELMWQKLMESFSNQNNTEALRDKAIEQLTKSDKGRRNTLQSIQRLLDQDQWYEAEAKMDDVWDDFYNIGGFLNITDREPFYRPCEQTSGLVLLKTRPDRMKVGKEVLEEESKKALEPYRRLVETAKTAAKQLSVAGVADVGGSKMLGPDIVQAIVDEWKLGNIQLQRAAVLQRAVPHEGTGVARGMDKVGRSDEWESMAKSFSSDLQNAIRDVIDADASKLSAADASKHFMQYIQILSPYAARWREAYWTDSLHDALGRLAKRAEAEEEFKNYDQATSDLLRWRAKIAKQQSLAMIGSFPALGPLAESLLVNKSDSKGFYTEEGPTKGLPLLKHSVPDLAPLLGKGIQDRQVTASGAVRLDNQEKQVWMTRLDRNIYCRIQGNLLLEDPVKLLAKELMIDDKHPALTVLAGGAIQSAQRGDYDAIGGRLSSPSLEATTARFASLPPSASPIIPLDGVVGGGQGNVALEGLAIRCTLTPEWVQHRYYFVKLASPQ